MIDAILLFVAAVGQGGSWLPPDPPKVIVPNMVQVAAVAPGRIRTIDEPKENRKPIGAQSYDRAFQTLKETKKPQACLFVFGDRQAAEIAKFLSDLKARGIELPWVVDLNHVNTKVREFALKSKTDKNYNGPFLQTLHWTGNGYGPWWRRIGNTDPDEYLYFIKQSKVSAKEFWNSNNNFQYQSWQSSMRSTPVQFNTRRSFGRSFGTACAT